MRAWHFMIIFWVASSMLGLKRLVLRNWFVFTFLWCISCDGARICFRRDCGTTIRLPLKISPLKIENSSFMQLYSSRSVLRDHFRVWIWAINVYGMTSLLVSDLKLERVTALRSDIFWDVNESYLVFANETGSWRIMDGIRYSKSAVLTFPAICWIWKLDAGYGGRG